jgi:putative membrane protein
MAESTTEARPFDRTTWLAVERTRVAYERTMLAWVRTGTSLITFGFGVYKFFQIERKPGADDHWMGSQGFGLILVAIGLAALALATVEYRQNMRSLQTDYLGRQSRLTVVFAGLVATLGILAFVVMLFRQ